MLSIVWQVTSKHRGLKQLHTFIVLWGVRKLGGSASGLVMRLKSQEGPTVMRPEWGGSIYFKGVFFDIVGRWLLAAGLNTSSYRYFHRLLAC
jgi:hypothetical protein